MKPPTPSTTFVAVILYVLIAALLGTLAASAGPRTGMWFCIVMGLVMLSGAWPRGDPRNLLLFPTFYVMISLIVDFVIYRLDEHGRFGLALGIPRLVYIPPLGHSPALAAALAGAIGLAFGGRNVHRLVYRLSLRPGAPVAHLEAALSSNDASIRMRAIRTLARRSQRDGLATAPALKAATESRGGARGGGPCAGTGL
jgi:hypothetical protein